MAFLEYTPTTTLFKYCSTKGFEGIISSKNLWFTDILSVNDPREIKLGYQHFREALDVVRAECNGNAALLDQYAETLDHYFDNSIRFVCCFSLNNDSLPMWAAYGADYGGIAIGFRPTSLTGIPARMQKVQYIENDAAESFTSLVKSVVALLKSNPNDFVTSVQAHTAAIAVITATKHADWSYEREIRLCYSQLAEPPGTSISWIPASALPDGTETEWKEPNVRQSEIVEGNVYFLEFPFGRYRQGRFDPIGAIESVVLGPKCKFSEEDVAAALTTNGFANFEVRRSKCKIR